MKRGLLLLGILGLAGCPPIDQTGPSAGVLTVTPGSYDFQDASVGTSSARATFTVTNTGGSPSGIVNVTVGGTDASQFSIFANHCATAGPLGAGVSCTFDASFIPSGSTGARSATLVVQGLPAASDAAAIQGTVPPVSATITLSPATHNFGYNGNFDFTVTNTGGAASGSPVIHLSGPYAANFSVLTNGCTASLAAGASCVITVRFNGLEGSSIASAWLNVSFPAGAVTPSHLTGLGL